MVPPAPALLGWRDKPGILGQHASSPQSVHALLGYFLRDRRSPTPFPGRDRLAREGLFEWGLAPPLEKVIETQEHLQALLQMPELYRQSVSVIEPWPNVGTNQRGETVRASKNLAYVLQRWRTRTRSCIRCGGAASVIRSASPTS